MLFVRHKVVQRVGFRIVEGFANFNLAQGRGPTCSPDPRFTGTPDMILTLVQSTRPLPSGVKITSGP